MKTISPKSNTLILTALAVSILFPALSRGAGIEFVKAQAGEAFESSIASAMEQAKPAHAFGPTDLFQQEPACDAVDAHTFMPPTIEDSLRMIQPCLEAISRRFAVPVTAQSEVSQVLDQAPKTTVGINIQILAAALPQNSSLLQDLQYSLDRRNRIILGYPAKIVWASAQSKMRIQIQSSLQNTINHCVVLMVLRPIETVDDFIRYYGRCLAQDPSLKIKSMQSLDASPRNIGVWSDGSDSEIAGMNGTLTVHGANGPVAFQVQAYR